MDEPNTNWKILDLIEFMLDEEEYLPLDCIGSCGLDTADWPIEKLLLRALFKLLQHSPAQRVEYLCMYVTGLWLEKFCILWSVKNEPVAKQVIDIWDDIVKLIWVFCSKSPVASLRTSHLIISNSTIQTLWFLYTYIDISSRCSNGPISHWESGCDIELVDRVYYSKWSPH